MKDYNSMSLVEIAIDIQSQPNAEKLTFNELYKKICEIKQFTEEEAKAHIAQFYTDVTACGDFIYCGEDLWDLKKNQKLEAMDSEFYQEHSGSEEEDEEEEKPKPKRAKKAHKSVEEIEEEENAEEADTEDEGYENASFEDYESDEEEYNSYEKDFDSELDEDDDSSKDEDDEDDVDEDKYNDIMDKYEDLYDN